ncbi:MAG: protein phosphatase 2C domain-containing protein [Burkholderiales bacterium]
MTGDSLEVTALSDVGNVRQFNEDSVAVDADNGILALADGMGGHRAGEVASRLATEILMDGLTAAVAGFRPNMHQHAPLLAVEQSINRANRAIIEAGRADVKFRGMGTTLALAVFYDDQVTLAHVGDSRIYRVRDNRLQLLTRDDSLLRDQVELGLISAAEANQSHNRSLVTRALGLADTVAPHIAQDDAQPGDVYLVCSDGLNDLVDDDDIELIVTSLRANLPLAAQVLVQAAKDNGGIDNVSVILARVREAFPAGHPGWFTRLFDQLRRFWRP